MLQNMFTFVILFSMVLHVLSTTIVINPVSTSTSLFCDNATTNDTCIINCNLTYAVKESTINCGNAGECIINCYTKMCIEKAIINATNSKDFYIYAGATDTSQERCISDTDIYLPINGNATIIANNSGNEGEDYIIDDVTIYSQSTNRILISCIGSDNYQRDRNCDFKEIRASDAQYLEFHIFESRVERLDLYCPVGSDYIGDSSSCVINVANSTSIKDLNIHTEYGWPTDITFIQNPSGNYKYSRYQVTLYCNAGSNYLSTAYSFEGTQCASCKDYKSADYLFSNSLPADSTFSASPSIYSYKNDVSLNLLWPNKAGGTMTCIAENTIIRCNDTASCTDSTIYLQDMTGKKVNIICTGKFGCIGSRVRTIGNNNDLIVNIICQAQYGCTDMEISISNYSDFKLFCLSDKACQDIILNLNYEQNIPAKIYCTYLYACNGMNIITDSVDTTLYMGDYSEDVILNNGVGYLSAIDNIVCYDERYIKVVANGVTFDDIYNLAQQKYDGSLLPCNGVGVVCG
eukprot:412166_1